MDKLKKSIEKTRKSNLARLKGRYALAKELGFDSYEAGKLAQRSEKYIRELAEKIA